MTTRFDEEPEFDGTDDPLAVILRPPAAHLGPPPGRYEEIRRTASRRRLVRAATGAGVTCAVAALVALQLHVTAPSAPVSPRVPLAPPAVSPTTPHRPTTSPVPVSPSAIPSVAPDRSGTAQTRTRPPSAPPSAVRVAPSEDRRRAAATPSPS
ncbi:hypothetical protein ABZ357_39920 [Streptomyces sp. NPDC005917]|uniref:hypothetical protein n=1 Tax=unclassified Streptomyces TaxID=2593676 RepID=UPI0033F49DCA